MRGWIIKYRGFAVTKRELIADLIFFLIPFIIVLLALYFFDIHWSFYPDQTIFPPSKRIGLTFIEYIAPSLVFGIVGFFLIKLFLIGVKEARAR